MGHLLPPARCLCTLAPLLDSHVGSLSLWPLLPIHYKQHCRALCRYDRQGLTAALRFYAANELPPALLDWALGLTRDHMAVGAVLCCAVLCCAGGAGGAVGAVQAI